MSLAPYVTGVLRLIVVPAGLAWVFIHAPQLGWAQQVSLHPLWLVAALILNQIALFLFSVRLRLILGLWSVRLGWMASFRIHLQSMFYFIVVPMTVGLEIARYIKIKALDPSVSKTGLAAALLVDRIVGALSALVLALLCLPLLRFTVAPPLATPWLLAVLAALLVGLAAAVIWGRWRRQVGDAWRFTFGRRKVLVGIFVLSMIMHVVFALCIQTAAMGLGTPVTFTDVLFAVSGGMLFLAVPVSLAGIGPADAGAAALLVLLGHAVSDAVVVGALPYLARLIAAIEGGLWEFADGGRAAFAAARGHGDSEAAAPAAER